MPETLTANDAECFATNGYLVLTNLIPMSTVAWVREDSQALLATLLHRMVSTTTADPRVTWWRLESGRPYVLKIKPVADLVPSAAALALSPQLTSVAAKLLGSAPRHRSGAVGGVQSTTRVFGQSFGTALVAVAYGLHVGHGATVALLLAATCAVLAVGVNTVRSAKLAAPQI